jgi:hypothetical protein
MKKSILKISIIALPFLVTIIISCKKYLNIPPVGSLSSEVLANKNGVDGMLIGAYALLNMNANPTFHTDAWNGELDNWVLSGIASDDAYKGSTPTDNIYAAQIMNHTMDASNIFLKFKWAVLYDGIQRANDVIRELPLVKDGSVTSEYAVEVTAEARFLRGIFHLEVAKIWRNVPYVDETITYSAGNYNVPNDGPIWDKIEADFTAAMNVLPETQKQIGRANKYAAEAFLAKTYMFDHKYDLAKTALEDLITNGKTAGGKKYDLEPFHDNFNAATENGPESVFAVQMSVQDQAQGQNGNPTDILNFPAAGPTTCCGFYQPSFSLINSFKVDPATGLPLFDTFNNADLKSDQTVPANDATYFPDTTTPVDSRLDWTVGRRGIPFLDYGLMPGASWARAQGDAGPYINVKNVYEKSQAAEASDNYQGWAPGQSSALNYNFIRFSDILLWAAECEVEVGSLAKAEEYVNRVRSRAANQSGWVKGRLTGYGLKDGKPDVNKPIVDESEPAANYKVGLYTAQIANGTKEFARKAIWFERKLEFAMEGARFFDLQRYDGLDGGPAASGYMANTLNAYIAHDTKYPIDYFANSALQGAKFIQGRNELYPLPQHQIDLQQGTLKQNSNY